MYSVVCLMVRTSIDSKKAMLVAIYCISLAYKRDLQHSMARSQHQNERRYTTGST